MGHRRPKKGDVKTGDGPLMSVAADTCLDVLMTDFRIEQCYDQWVSAHDLERLERRAFAWLTVEAVAKFQASLFSGPRDEETAALAVVLTQMGVPWSWCADALLYNRFPWRYWNDYARRRSTPERPIRQQKLLQYAEMIETATSSRKPAADDLDSLARHVHYWYRRKIKDPHDSLAELEAAELARTGEREILSRRHSTILQGISRVEYLLGLFTASEIEFHARTPPPSNLQ